MTVRSQATGSRSRAASPARAVGGSMLIQPLMFALAFGFSAAIVLGLVS